MVKAGKTLDVNSKGTPLSSLVGVNDIHFVYNATTSNKTFTLSATMHDMSGAAYSGTITLSPYASTILLGAGTVT